MKICHLITRMIVGGAQENTLYTIIGHLENELEAVLVTGPSPGPEGRLLQKREISNLRIVLQPHLVRELNPCRDALAYLSLRRLFAREAFDVVHTHSSKAGVIGRLAARAAGVPVVVHTIHGQAFHKYEKWWRNRLFIFAERVAARRCDRIYAVCRAMIDQCVAANVAPEGKYRVVYSGMKLEPFFNAQPDMTLASELGIPPGTAVVGKIARLFELKGYEYLLQAAPLIIAEVPNVRFLIVGDGAIRPAIERQIRTMGLEDHFVFAGLVAPAEIPKYTALMDVLVHLSLREGLPRTIIQAHAGGKPAIGFALDGTPEAIVDGETGYVCPPADHRAVAAGVTELLRNPERARRMGEAGREHIRHRWDWRQMVDTLEQEYRELLGEADALRPLPEQSR